MNPHKISLAKQYSTLAETVLGNNLVSVFLFGSVARGEDTEQSDIDIMTVVNGYPTTEQLGKLGRTGRFNEQRGYGIFKDVSCALVTRDRFLSNLEMGAPREGINPLTDALILYDTGLMKDLKEQLDSGSISLRDDAYWDYLRYGDIRRSYLMRNLKCKDLEAARSDAAASGAHYIRAYFLCENGEMIVSKRVLVERIREGCPGIAGVYDGVLEGEFDKCVVLDSLDEIRKWVIEKIYSLKKPRMNADA
ncbi:MAG: nucleotidyltransferase domain-containing protein [ANME-2 cluster archaeon]|nr:nucleotidyltransferase domain-containing protein [ANME-2 cluster archaeon]